jgi:fluoride exporter
VTERAEREREARWRPLRRLRLAGRPPPPGANGSPRVRPGSPPPQPVRRDAGPALAARRATPRGWLGGRARPAVLGAIAAGGAIGGPTRYLIGKGVHIHPGSFPWGTFWVNISGSFAVGVLLTLVIERWPPIRFVRPFAAVGFLGAYTTFSTFGVETDLLISAGRIHIAVAYVLGSVGGGLAAVVLGIGLGRLWPGGERS